MIAISYGVVAPLCPCSPKASTSVWRPRRPSSARSRVVRVLFAPVGGRLVGRWRSCRCSAAVCSSSLPPAPRVPLRRTRGGCLLFTQQVGLGSTMFTVRRPRSLVRISPPALRERASGASAAGFLHGQRSPVRSSAAGSSHESLRAPFFAYAGSCSSSPRFQTRRSTARGTVRRAIPHSWLWRLSRSLAVVRLPAFRAALDVELHQRVDGLRRARRTCPVVRRRGAASGRKAGRALFWRRSPPAPARRCSSAARLADRRGRRLPVLIGSATVAVASLWLGSDQRDDGADRRLRCLRRRHGADEPWR